MNTRKLLTITVVSASLAFGVVAQAHENEQPISNADVPSAVQQAANTKLNGGKIVRWEKEGENYEAVIDRNGKQMGFTFDANGKFVSKHNESTEHKEKGEKY